MTAYLTLLAGGGLGEEIRPASRQITRGCHCGDLLGCREIPPPRTAARPADEPQDGEAACGR